jgi:hypothetical protein
MDYKMAGNILPNENVSCYPVFYSSLPIAMIYSTALYPIKYIKVN